MTPTAVSSDLTQWLASLTPGQAHDEAVTNELFCALYNEIHRQARGRIWREASDHTLSATALTHEVWFRMTEQSRTRWQSRQHFLAVASTMMRRILVNHAVARQSQKRDAREISLSEVHTQLLSHEPDRDVVRVHEALLAFEALDARAAKVVEMRFFAGMEISAVADALGVSEPTVKRDWALARAWLHRALTD